MSDKKLKVTRGITGSFEKVVSESVKIMREKRFKKDE